MTAKSRFFKKLQEKRPRNEAFDTKAEADIAAFRRRISQLRESMETWLAGTEVRTEATTTSLVELLIGRGAFSVPGITLFYGTRRLRFTPHFSLRAGRDRLHGGLPVYRC